MNNITEVDNIYPSYIQKYFIKSSEREKILSLKSHVFSVCRNEIDSDYIRKAFNKFKEGIVYYRGGMPFAICIWKINEHTKTIHILLICASKSEFKVVDSILNDLTIYCLKNNYKYITLNPINDTIHNYYMKYGFKNINTTDNSLMIKQIEVFTIKSTRKTLKKKINNKLNSIKTNGTTNK